MRSAQLSQLEFTRFHSRGSMLLQTVALPDRVTGQSISSAPSPTSLVTARKWDFARLRLVKRWCVSFKSFSDDSEGLFGVLQGYDARGMLAMDRENGLWVVLGVSEFTFGIAQRWPDQKYRQG